MFDFLMLMKSELLITALIFIILILKLRTSDQVADQSGTLGIINIMLGINFVCGFFMNQEGELFGDMFKSTALLSLEKNMLNLGTLVISLHAWHWLKTHKHVHEFYMLMLSTLLGMFLMISADNLLMFYLGLELSTIPLAAIVNFDLDRKRSSEAAMKMIMMSAFSSAILLSGISFVYGTTGSLSLSVLPSLLSHDPLQMFTLVLLIAGFGFKISAVPFHLWTADVYEGAPASVTAYLSVISKGAVIFVMIPVMYSAFKPMEAEWYQIIMLISVATMVIGNLFAVRQNNLKRLLAFSSITQVGFILVGMTGQSDESSASVIYFVLIYIFSNLGAFGIVTLVSALTGKETIDDYRDFYRTNPFLSWILAISLFSLAGIPPTAGFFGKFFLLLGGAEKGNYIFIIIAALNMIVSLYYYLRIIKAVFMDKNENPVPAIQTGWVTGSGMIICVLGIIFAGIYGEVHHYIYQLVSSE